MQRLTTRALVAAIRGYQRTWSRWTTPCPDQPSCSDHAIAAISQYGARQGLLLALAGIQSCGSRTLDAQTPPGGRHDSDSPAG